MNNSTKNTYKISFIAKIHYLKLALKFPCTISIVWKRSDRSSQTKQKS